MQRNAFALFRAGSKLCQIGYDATNLDTGICQRANVFGIARQRVAHQHQEADVAKQNRMIVWQGPSRLDGTEIVVLATGLAHRSANSKTGGMVQLWILRADTAPHRAIALGLDTCICGDCPHRGKASGGTGACYVNTGQGPRSIWEAHQRNGIGTGPRQTAPYDLGAFTGRLVRIGAYGDPAAVPTQVWRKIAAVAEAVTGYTHQWRKRPSLREVCMASVDSAAELATAVATEWRGFYARPVGTPAPRGTVVCPASAEAGKRVTCSTCLQCGGTGNGRRASITIEAHGSTARRLTDRAALATAGR